MKKQIKSIMVLFCVLSLMISGCDGKKEAVVKEEKPRVELELPSFETKEEEPKEETISITISATGDVTMGNYIGQGYAGSFDQTYEKKQDFGYFFQNVRDIFAEDDMTIVNLEGVLTTSENAAPGRDFSIKGDPAYVNILPKGNVDVVSMENNHRRDFGEQGTADTVAALNSVNIPYAYEENLGYYETKGITIGWVAVNHASFGSSVESLLKNGIKRLKEEGVDLILACCHWGIERTNYPTDAQRDLGKKCIKWGADLVIGHHPHVIQGFEKYQGKYIVYSLGNFCFAANKNPDDKDSMIFQQTFTFTKRENEDGSVTTELTDYGKAKAIPCSISSVTGRNDFCPTPLMGENAKRVIKRLNKYSNDYGVTVYENGILN